MNNECIARSRQVNFGHRAPQNGIMMHMLFPARHLTLFVLSDPTDKRLGLLEELPDATDIIVGDRIGAFTSGAEEADIMLVREVPRDLVQDVWQLTERLRWIHVQSSDVDRAIPAGIGGSSATLTSENNEDLRVFLDNFKRFQKGEPLLNTMENR